METGLGFALAALFAHLVEKLKQSNVISQTSDTIQKFTALVAAVIGAVGITTAWTVDPTTQLGTLTFGGIPTTFDQWAALGVMIFQQYWFQKGYYLAAIKPHIAGVKTRGVGTGDPDK